jgi:hypothetical protein
MNFGSENGVLALIFFIFNQNIMPALCFFFFFFLFCFLTQHKLIASPRKAPLKDQKKKLMKLSWAKEGMATRDRCIWRTF